MTLRNAFENLAVETKQDDIITALRHDTIGLFTQDDYNAGQCLADQSGSGGVLTFNFSTPVNLVVVLSNGTDLIARADPFGGTPAATQGFVCGDDIPVYLPVTTSSVKVFAPAGTTISVAGFRRV